MREVRGAVFQTKFISHPSNRTPHVHRRMGPRSSPSIAPTQKLLGSAVFGCRGGACGMLCTTYAIIVSGCVLFCSFVGLVSLCAVSPGRCFPFACGGPRGVLGFFFRGLQFFCLGWHTICINKSSRVLHRFIRRLTVGCIL